MVLFVFAIFRDLRDRRFHDADGSHAERNCHARKCNAYAAQTLLLPLAGSKPTAMCPITYEYFRYFTRAPQGVASFSKVDRSTPR